jgi:hypothetical protein
MDIQIIWHPDDDIQVADQKGASFKTTIVVEGNKYTLSFMTFDALKAIMAFYLRKNAPMLNSDWKEYVLIEEMTEETIRAAVRYLVQHNQIRWFPFNPDPSDTTTSS